MNKKEIIKKIIPHLNPKKNHSKGIAPINIALCKYWGKRNIELNLPVSPSLSLSLPYYTKTEIILNDDKDFIYLNDVLLSNENNFSKRLINYLDLFRPKNTFFTIKTYNEIPTGAGLASSASGFAALVFAINDLFEWNLKKKYLTILARLGSGSASRSIYEGFVEWNVGKKDDGMDSYASKIDTNWEEIEISVCLCSDNEKSVSSTEGMNRSSETSKFFQTFVMQSYEDFDDIKNAIAEENFKKLGIISERNALQMHSTMITSSPGFCYFIPETIKIMNHVWDSRKNGLDVYMTMDAGPNVKLIHRKKDNQLIKKEFSNITSFL